LTALRPWIGHNLPVVRERLAGSEIPDYGSDEGYGEEDVEVSEHLLVRALPDAFGEGAEVDAHAVFGYPETVGLVSIVFYVKEGLRGIGEGRR
jgi:hypothetical protein